MPMSRKRDIGGSHLRMTINIHYFGIGTGPISFGT
jgi:hypothetical protein